MSTETNPEFEKCEELQVLETRQTAVLTLAAWLSDYGDELYFQPKTGQYEAYTESCNRFAQQLAESAIVFAMDKDTLRNIAAMVQSEIERGE